MTNPKNRHNIDTIATVLIDKIDKMEKAAQRMEKAANSPISVDTREFEMYAADMKEFTNSALHEQIKLQKAFLSDLKASKLKNHTRVPGSVVIALALSFGLCISMMWYSWSMAEDYSFSKAKAEKYEKLYKQGLQGQKE